MPMKKVDTLGHCVSCGAKFRRPPSNMGLYCSRRCWYDSKPKTPIVERLWRRVDTTGGPMSCWEWTGARLKTGYGSISSGAGGPPVRAHRVAYEAQYGEITGGLHVMHSCDNRLCCNPAHLSLGTPAMNCDDKISKGRDVRGESHKGSKLSSVQVAEIRSLSAAGVKGTSLAARYSVSTARISTIINNKARVHG